MNGERGEIKSDKAKSERRPKSEIRRGWALGLSFCATGLNWFLGGFWVVDAEAQRRESNGIHHEAWQKCASLMLTRKNSQ